MQRIIALFLLVWFLPTAQSAVVGEEVTYRVGDSVFKGYIATDDAIDGKRPGVLVVHEWWGNNDYTRKRADMLAELGYTAMALDMYGDGKVADHPDDAGKFAGEVQENMAAPRRAFVQRWTCWSNNPASTTSKSRPSVIASVAA